MQSEVEILRDLLSRECARHQNTIADRNRLRGIMTDTIDNSLPGYGGYCQLHHRALPCPSCTSAPPPVAIPSVWGAPPPYTDPWMGVSPNLSPLPPQPLYGYRFVASACEHCFCVEEDTDVREGHQKCCNCGVQRLRTAVSFTHQPDAFIDD